jgi:hypothetical protein
MVRDREKPTGWALDVKHGMPTNPQGVSALGLNRYYRRKIEFHPHAKSGANAREGGQQ